MNRKQNTKIPSQYYGYISSFIVQWCPSERQNSLAHPFAEKVLVPNLRRGSVTNSASLFTFFSILRESLLAQRLYKAS